MICQMGCIADAMSCSDFPFEKKKKKKLTFLHLAKHNLFSSNILSSIQDLRALETISGTSFSIPNTAKEPMQKNYWMSLS